MNRALNVNAVIGQSGGPTSAINATLAGIICGLRGRVGKIYGMKNGISGLLAGDLVDLSPLQDNGELLDSLALTPAAALGSCRHRLPVDFSDPSYEKIFDVLYRHGIGYFFYIGGNDSMDTVARLSTYAHEKGRDVSVIGVPKTIDNDLVFTHHCPGYGSAAKYVATTVYEIARDISVYNLPSVTIVEVMGRDTGWLGCAASLSQFCFGKGSDLVYLPETGFSVDVFLGDIENTLLKKNNVLACVSEGVLPTHTSGTLDAFGHGSLGGIGKALESSVREGVGCKVRAVELNLPQRCAGHMVSRADIEGSVAIGRHGAEAALEGHSGKMVGFVSSEYSGKESFYLTDASLVANKIRHVPRDFITNDGKFITDRCAEYLSPLIEGEMEIKYVMGMPHHFDLGGYLCTK